MKNLRILTSVILVLFTISCARMVKIETAETAKQKLVPLSQVKKGARGYGKTVFEGDKPQKFNAEIIGIWPSFGMEFILAKISGGPNQIIARTGVIAGMSGSPIYVKGKLIGALSRSFINQREPKCLITPIENMLDPPNVEGPGSSNNTVAPINIPVSSYGFSQRTLNLVKPFLKKQGLNFEFVSGSSGGSKVKNTSPSSLKPGDAIAVELMGGEFGLYAVGTTTYIYKNKVYAFGHGMFNKGEKNVDLPFYKASILDVVAAAQSFKLTEKILEPCLGSIKRDTPTAIVGILEAKPEIIPVRINLKDGKYEKIFNDIRLPKKFFVTDILALMAIINAITLEKADIPEATIKLSMRIIISDPLFEVPLAIENSTFTTTDKAGLGIKAISDFHMLLYHELKPLLESPVETNLEKIEFAIEISERKVFEIGDAIIKKEGKTLEPKWSGSKTLKLLKESLKPGDAAELNLLVKEIYTGQRFLSNFDFVIPENTPDGRAIMIVVNGKWLCWLLSTPELSLGKDSRAAKDFLTLIISVISNNKPDPDKFYILLILPTPQKTDTLTETKEEKQIKSGWKPIKNEDLGKTFPTSQLMIVEVSPNLEGETRGLFQFVLQIKSQPDENPDENIK